MCDYISTHLQVDIGEEYLLVAGVDDCGVVGAGKDVSGARRLEALEDYGLSAQHHTSADTQLSYTKNTISWIIVYVVMSAIILIIM